MGAACRAGGWWMRLWLLPGGGSAAGRMQGTPYSAYHAHN